MLFESIILFFLAAFGFIIYSFIKIIYGYDLKSTNSRTGTGLVLSIIGVMAGLCLFMVSMPNPNLKFHNETEVAFKIILSVGMFTFWISRFGYNGFHPKTQNVLRKILGTFLVSLILLSLKSLKLPFIVIVVTGLMIFVLISEFKFIRTISQTSIWNSMFEGLFFLFIIQLVINYFSPHHWELFKFSNPF